MHTFSISAATGVLLVLADPAMAGADASSPLPILLEPGCHPCALHHLRLLNLWGGLRREEIIGKMTGESGIGRYKHDRHEGCMWGCLGLMDRHG